MFNSHLTKFFEEFFFPLGPFQSFEDCENQDDDEDDDRNDDTDNETERRGN